MKSIKNAARELALHKAAKVKPQLYYSRRKEASQWALNVCAGIAVEKSTPQNPFTKSTRSCGVPIVRLL